MSKLVLDVSNNNPITADLLHKSDAVGLICKATEGTTFRDHTYITHRDTARVVGVPFGGYVFLHASAGGNEAEFFLEFAKPKKGDIQPVVDAEAGGLDGVSVGVMAKRALACLRALTANGYKPLWYSNLAFAEAALHYEPGLKRFRLWVAQYAAQRSPVGHGATVVLWQFSESYRVHDRRYDASRLYVPIERLLIP